MSGCAVVSTASRLRRNAAVRLLKIAFIKILNFLCSLRFPCEPLPLSWAFVVYPSPILGTDRNRCLPSPRDELADVSRCRRNQRPVRLRDARFYKLAVVGENHCRCRVPHFQGESGGIVELGKVVTRKRMTERVEGPFFPQSAAGGIIGECIGLRSNFLQFDVELRLVALRHYVARFVGKGREPLRARLG